jgi:Helix-turn-helix domain
MADKFVDWPIKFDVAETLGLSLRSIERLIKEKRIRVTRRRIPGRKALTICNKEGSEYSGLPQSSLRRLIKERKLKALSAGGYRVRRADLEKL